MKLKALLYLGILFSTLTILQLLIKTNSNNTFKIKGKFNKELKTYNTIDKIKSHLDSKFTENDTANFISEINTFLSERFYHGTQRIEFQESYLAYIASFFWSDFSMKTNPAEILKGDIAVCNQSTIVLQEVLSSYNFKFRSVCFNKHIATEVKYNNRWHIIDCDYEPNLISYNSRPSAKQIFSNKDSLMVAYSHVKEKNYNKNYTDFINTKSVKYKYGKQGQNLSFIQIIFYYWSWFGGFAILALYFFLKLYKSLKKISNV